MSYRFKEFEVGDWFYLEHQPLRQFIHYSGTGKSNISPKLQHRFTGPYQVEKKFSPVLYGTTINGEFRTVHALKMLHDPVSKYLNPYELEEESEDDEEKKATSGRNSESRKVVTEDGKTSISTQTKGSNTKPSQRRVDTTTSMEAPKFSLDSALKEKPTPEPTIDEYFEDQKEIVYAKDLDKVPANS
jgi:hypothetical protein